MLLSAVSVLVVARSSLEIPVGLMNNPVYLVCYIPDVHRNVCLYRFSYKVPLIL